MITRAQQLEIALTHFRAGITAVLRTWPALKTAVQSEWGGIESYAKADDLRTNIFEFYDGSKAEPLTWEELEDNLFTYLEEEFSVMLEDESERQIADLICRMYKECGEGNVQLVEHFVRLSIAQSGSKEKVVVQEDPEMESDDEDDGEENPDQAMDDAEQNTTTATIASAFPVSASTFQYNLETAKLFTEGPLFPGGRATKPPPSLNQPPPRQLGESEPEKPKVELDEDGFAPVVSRKGRRGK